MSIASLLNHLFCGMADDIIVTEGGGDAYGGKGEDIISCGSQADDISGGDQRDILSGNCGNDEIDGGDSYDDLFGGAIADGSLTGDAQVGSLGEDGPGGLDSGVADNDPIPPSRPDPAVSGAADGAADDLAQEARRAPCQDENVEFAPQRAGPVRSLLQPSTLRARERRR